MALSLSSKVDQLHGVGPAIHKRLQRLDISTILELLFYFPKKHDDYSDVINITDASPGSAITVCGEVTAVRKRQSWKRRFSLTEITLRDDSGSLNIIWFNQPYIANQLKKGDRIYASGKVSNSKKYGQQMNNPMFEKYKQTTTHTARIVPQYSLTKGITQKQLRYYMRQALDILGEETLPDWLPEDMLDTYDLQTMTSAVQLIHFPDTWQDVEKAQYRLGFDELLLVQLFSRATRDDIASQQATSVPFKGQLIKDFVAALPFTLTQAQRKAAWDIIKDMQSDHPMNRLLEGDVGSGKTVVAAIGMYSVYHAGLQSVLMAPTEILAEQHYKTLLQVFNYTDVSIGLWTRSLRTSNGKQHAMGVVNSDSQHSIMQCDIIIGTHALIQESISLKKLGLAVIDEQHRFGVRHRKRLREHSDNNSTTPHLLSMTATPIPRSLALTVYGDLELSILNELPAGRKPITTQMVSATPQRSAMYSHINERLLAGDQIYIVVPRIEDEGNDKAESKDTMASITSEYERISKKFPEATIAELHGKLKAAEKQRIMQEFVSGKIHILVATTVIEVGIDVPNATMMIIENADRFGLAQLHQLRGRVGRSDKQSFCYVCTDGEAERSKERLDFFTNTSDGFALAEFDLESRGPGDVFGRQQSGFLSHFKMAKLTDKVLVKATREAADTIFENITHYPDIKTRLDHFIKQVHLE